MLEQQLEEMRATYQLNSEVRWPQQPALLRVLIADLAARCCGACVCGA
jgi:hypothetical protein